jgi:hypothetical protein
MPLRWLFLSSLFFSFDSSQPFSLTSFGNGAGSSALPPLSTTLWYQLLVSSSPWMIIYYRRSILIISFSWTTKLSSLLSMTIAYDPTSGNRYPMNHSDPSVTFPMSHYDLATSNLRMKASAYQHHIPFPTPMGLFSENNTPHDDSHPNICPLLAFPSLNAHSLDTISSFNPPFGPSLYSLRRYHGTIPVPRCANLHLVRLRCFNRQNALRSPCMKHLYFNASSSTNIAPLKCVIRVKRRKLV